MEQLIGVTSLSLIFLSFQKYFPSFLHTITLSISISLFIWFLIWFLFDVFLILLLWKEWHYRGWWMCYVHQMHSLRYFVMKNLFEEMKTIHIHSQSHRMFLLTYWLFTSPEVSSLPEIIEMIESNRRIWKRKRERKRERWVKRGSEK